MTSVVASANRVQLPNNAFESGRADKRRVLELCFPRRAAQRER